MITASRKYILKLLKHKIVYIKGILFIAFRVYKMCEILYVCERGKYCEDLKSFPDKIYATDLSYYTQDRLPLAFFIFH